MFYNFSERSDKMYTVKETLMTADDGASIVMYGIKSDRFCFESLTSDRNAVCAICDLCNRLDLDEDQLIDVIDDIFLH